MEYLFVLDLELQKYVMLLCDLSPEKFQRTPLGDCAHILKIPFVAFFKPGTSAAVWGVTAVTEKSLSVKSAPLVADKVIRHHVTSTSSHQHIVIPLACI